MAWIQLACAELTPNTIRRCWIKANILSAPMQAQLNQDVDRSVPAVPHATMDALVTAISAITLEQKRALVEDVGDDDSPSTIGDAIVAFDETELVSEIDVACVDVLLALDDEDKADDFTKVYSDDDEDGPDYLINVPSLDEALAMCGRLIKFARTSTDIPHRCLADLHNVNMELTQRQAQTKRTGVDKDFFVI
jgi:hypothetical protein